MNMGVGELRVEPQVPNRTQRSVLLFFSVICNILHVSPTELLQDSLTTHSQYVEQQLGLEQLNCTAEELKFAKEIAEFSVKQKRKYQ